MGATETLFTPDARRHAAAMARSLLRAAPRLERKGRALLQRRGCDPALRRSFLAIAPAGFARLESLDRFLEEVEYQGRRLAKHNLSPPEVQDVLAELEGLLDPVLQGCFAPSREQLHLATVLALDRAFYQVREAEAQALFGIYRAEAEAKDTEDLLRRVAQVLARASGARAAWVLTGPDLDRRLRCPLFIRRGTLAGRLIPAGNQRARFESYWSFPLDRTAVVQLAFAVPYPWLPREQALLEIAAERCRGALERARLLEAVRRLESEARRAEDEERRRIGRELHDETGQSLLLLRLQLEMCEREAPEAVRARLRESRDLVERTVVELRRIIAALRPAVLERLGLCPALRHMATRFRQVHGAEVRVRIAGDTAAAPGPAQSVIYRAAQECLNNIAKHSQASRVNLLLRTDDKTIRLRVSDNGNGFRQGMPGVPATFGLAGMQERASRLGGTLRIEAAPGKGTTVVLELPRNAAMVAENVKNSRAID